MAHLDLQAGLVAQRLQLHLPEAVALAVAAPAVGGDQQPRRPRGPPTPQAAPPPLDRLDPELGGVAADADALPHLIMPQVVDPVGHRLPLARVREVVGIDLARPALGPPRLAGILEVPQRLLLLGIDRDRRFPPPLLRLHAPVDVPELRIAVGVAVPLPRLAAGVQAVPGVLAQVPHRGGAHRMPLGRQLLSQAARALAGPPQRRLRVAAAAGFDEAFQGRPDTRIGRGDGFAARAGPTLIARRRGVAGVQLADAAADGAVRQAGRGTDDRDAAPPQRDGFAGGPTPPAPPGQLGGEALVFGRDPSDAPLVPPSRNRSEFPTAH